MTSLKVIIKDINCTSCELGIKKHFSKINVKADVSFANESAIIEYDEKEWSQEDILNNIKSLGYRPSLNIKYKWTKEDYFEIIELVISSVFTFLFIINMFKNAGWIKFAPQFMSNGYVQFVMATFIQFYVGRRFYKGAYHQVKSNMYGMDTLVALSTTIAYIYSIFILIKFGPKLPIGQNYFFSISAEVITFLLIGKIIENIVKRKSKQTLQSILNVDDRIITLIKGKSKPKSQLIPGDEFVVKIGQSFPSDCVIINGTTTVDESSLTGESIPSNKNIGDEVMEGTINAGAAITVKVIRAAKDTKLQEIKLSIESLLSTKSNIQKFADKVSAIFVPVVFWIVIATFFGWLFIAKLPIAKALYYAIAVAVVACPCAIGLATPMSIINGASVAAKHEILYNKSDIFERFNDVDVIAFDKTGTITKGQLYIEKFAGDKNERHCFISLEIISLHPIAKGFMNYADKENCQKNLKFTNYKEIIGKGVEGTRDGKLFQIGSYDFVSKNATISKELKQEYEQMLEEGYVTVVGSKDGKIINIFGLKDQIKETSKDAIEQLHKQGVETVMITGDNVKTAHVVARKLGIDQVFGQIQPMQKKEIIERIQAQGKKVAFVGDGVNDATALSQADIAIVMASGADIAKSVADITLLESDLLMVSKSLLIAKATLKMIKLTLVFAFIWNASMIPLAALGYLQPWLAALAMSVESLTVLLVTQTLRIRKF